MSCPPTGSARPRLVLLDPNPTPQSRNDPNPTPQSRNDPNPTPQARTGVYPCPKGEPSPCRYYHNASLKNSSECVYYYCTKTAAGLQDSCCSYYDGTVEYIFTKQDGGTEAAAVLAGVDASWASWKLVPRAFAETGDSSPAEAYSYATPDPGIMDYATFANTSAAEQQCAAVAADLAARPGHWHEHWYDDNATDGSGEQIVTTAYINFVTTRIEFSQQYGLALQTNPSPPWQ